MPASFLDNVPMFVPTVRPNNPSTPTGKIQHSEKVMPYKGSRNAQTSSAEMDQRLADFANGDGHSSDLSPQKRRKQTQRQEKPRKAGLLPTPPDEHDGIHKEAVNLVVGDNTQEKREETVGSASRNLPTEDPNYVYTIMQTHIQDGQRTRIPRHMVNPFHANLPPAWPSTYTDASTER